MHNHNLALVIEQKKKTSELHFQMDVHTKLQNERNNSLELKMRNILFDE